MSVEVRRVEPQEAEEFGFIIRGMGEQLPRPVEWEEHAHPFHELLWNPRGASAIGAGQRVWTVAGAHGLWVPAGTRHTGRAGAGTLYRATFFDPETVAAISEAPVGVTITPLLAGLLDYVDTQELTEGERSRAEAVIIDLIRPSGPEVTLHLPQRDPARGIAETVLEDVAAAPSAAEWARRLGISPRTVTRSFQAETGVGYARWAAEARVHRALELLPSGMSVAETAEEVGFASSSAFIAAFKRVAGSTPGAFLPRE
ncbi:AraC family transcriptional regulator [Nesterenkonia populi]